jgi:hypothetical protein
MNKDELRRILIERLETFRKWPYAQLADRVESDRTSHDCLEYVEGTGADGTPYQMEFNAFWDDKPRGNVRVVGDLSALPRRPLFGFVPIYLPDVIENFIMTPDGRFAGEETANQNANSD